MIAVTLWAILRLFDGESVGPAIEPPTPPPPAAVTVEGVATWYDWRPGEAAAGPGLRALLGPDWRGRTVTVRPTGHCTPTKYMPCVTTVTLTDWCQCFYRTDRERLIDLDVRSFAQLAPASRGLINVTVEINP